MLFYPERRQRPFYRLLYGCLRHSLAPLGAVTLSTLFIVSSALAKEEKSEAPSLTEVQKKFVYQAAPPLRDKFSQNIRRILEKHKNSPGQPIREIFARWFPEYREITGNPTGVDMLSVTADKNAENDLLALAKEWASYAESAGKAKMSGTATWEAFRALNLSRKSKTAGEILGYKLESGLYWHPRYMELRGQGLVFTKWGWINKELAALNKGNDEKAPEGNNWLNIEEVDEKHALWKDARELRYTFHTLRTNLPIQQAVELGRRIDVMLEWNRARFLKVDGYREPEWPLQLSITATSEEFSELHRSLGNEVPGSPFGEYSYAHRVATVCAETCEPSYERTVGIAQHEITHAFFHACCPGQFLRGDNTPYGWMLEAVPAMVYYIHSGEPVDGDLMRKLKEKYGNAPSEMEAVIDFGGLLEGKDAFSDLNKKSYSDSINDLRAYIHGAAWSLFCLENDLYRESFLTFVGKCMAWSAEKDGFERLFGKPGDVSRVLGKWVKSKIEKS